MRRFHRWPLSIQGAPDNLMEALRGASVMEEHRVLMSAVIEKVQFERSLQQPVDRFRGKKEKNPMYTVAPETLSGVQKEGETGDQSVIAGD